MTDLAQRAHLITGGFPAGQPAGHDHDYARIRILEMLEERAVPCSVANDFVDIEKWLPVSRLLITYTAGPILGDPTASFVRSWLEAGGRWVALHGTSGGRAVRVEGSRQRRMLRTQHHEVLGAFFINHPPVRRFEVNVAQNHHRLVQDLPESFEVVDEPYMVEVGKHTPATMLMTSKLGPDPGPPGFGFQYDEDTAIFEDGVTRPIAWVREAGADGGVAYTTLGHCHTPATNSQPFVDASVDAEGTTPPTLRVTWESDAYRQWLRNGVAWGMRI